jgi:Rhs element Vgr protein
MTASSPVQLAGAETAFTIKCNGSAIDSTWQIQSIDIWIGVNKLPRARLVLSDGNPATETFPVSDSSALIPGSTLEIALGYDQQTTPVFSGLVHRHGLDITQQDPTRLVVEATDKAMGMTLARRNAVFENLTDSDLATKLIGAAGLKAAVTATSAQHESIVQYYCSDWDLLLIRAQLNGMVVLAEDATVTMAPPKTDGDPVLTLTYGESILSFRADMDASTQFAASAIKSVAWDPATQALAQSGTASASVTEPGNLSSDTLAQVFGVATVNQQSAGSLPVADLTAWSSAELLKTRLAKIRGDVAFQGCATVKPGDMVTLAGVGARFNGPAYVSAVHHALSQGLFITTLEIGLDPDWFSARAPGISAPGAAGQLPPISTLQTGLVVKLDEDPDGEFRVQISLPLLQADGQVWARLGGIYASNGFGSEFYPEIGDEVVVAFMNNDPRFPIILGSLYAKNRPPPNAPEAQNNQKSIVTRSKLRVDFFEDKKAIELSTPGKQSLRLDDDAKSITVKDINGNTATFDTSGITLSSATDMKLTAKGNITIEADANISIQATANLSMKGVQISANADATFSAQGNAEAKLTAAGIVTVQGALVKIN